MCPGRLQHGRETHFIEHVEPVVAGGAVRAERYGDAARSHVGRPARFPIQASDSTWDSASL